MMTKGKGGSLFVIAAPSGAGKTTLVKALVERNPELRFSISYTTRKQRKTEQHGRDYFFVSEDEFRALREKGELLESALVFDNHYGTSRSQVERHLSVFILPPSRQELERRLRGRKTDSDAVIERRLRDALGDMSHWDEFDYVIINDDLAEATAELEAVISGRGGKSSRNNPEVVKRIENILA